MGPWGFLKSFWSPTGRRCGSQYQATERTSDWAPRSCVKDCIICSKALLAADGGSGCILWTATGESLVVSWCLMGEGKFHWFSKSLFAEEMTVFYLVEPPSLSWNVNMLGVFATVTLGFCLGTMSKAAGWFAGWFAGNSQKGWPLDGKMMVSNTKTGIQETRVVLGSAVPVVSWKINRHSDRGLISQLMGVTLVTTMVIPTFFIFFSPLGCTLWLILPPILRRLRQVQLAKKTIAIGHGYPDTLE